MSNEKVFADGLIVKRREKAPDYVVCSLSIRVNEFQAFMFQHARDGWLNIECKQAKSGKYYAELDTWRPTDGTAAKAGIDNAKKALNAQPAGAPATYCDDEIPF